jgi:glycosyltransferase involved in cell wall biosynthesis
MTIKKAAKWPRVSIMIPTYNQSRVVGRAIESALAQDYPNLEVIVSDDCSGDETEDAVLPYLTDQRLRYYRNPRNLGRISNYHHTLYERATGVWALNLDGDDYLFDSSVITDAMLEKAKYLNEEIVAILGVLETRSLALRKRTTLPEHAIAGLFDGLDVFRAWPKTQFGHLATIYNVNLARQIDYYRLDTISSDWESILRLILHGKVVVLNRTVGVWNIHGDNVSTSAKIESWIKDYSYIEEAARYAVQHGINRDDTAAWARAMVRFHTKHIWNSNFSSSAKIKVFLPFLAGRYPFAISTLLNPGSITRNVLRLHPGLYSRAASLYHRQTRKSRMGVDSQTTPKLG